MDERRERTFCTTDLFALVAKSPTKQTTLGRSIDIVACVLPIHIPTCVWVTHGYNTMAVVLSDCSVDREIEKKKTAISNYPGQTNKIHSFIQ